MLCLKFLVHLVFLSCASSLLQRMILVQSIERSGYVFVLVVARCSSYALFCWRVASNTTHTGLGKGLSHLKLTTVHLRLKGTPFNLLMLLKQFHVPQVAHFCFALLMQSRIECLSVSVVVIVVV